MELSEIEQVRRKLWAETFATLIGLQGRQPEDAIDAANKAVDAFDAKFALPFSEVAP